MIKGIGTDIASIARFLPWIDEPTLMSRYFHPLEIEEVSKRAQNIDKAATLAARFAAKESLGKALGRGLRGLQLSDIWVQKDFLGKPELRVQNSARRVLEERGIDKIHLSLSHDGGLALAFVVLEGGVDE
ncbi:MAG: holo-ACP synthase [Spirochaetales bacterium]|nr:holo-ACP synthase [Spirochaetales bacterium]